MSVPSCPEQPQSAALSRGSCSAPCPAPCPDLSWKAGHPWTHLQPCLQPQILLLLSGPMDGSCSIPSLGLGLSIDPLTCTQLCCCIPLGLRKRFQNGKPQPQLWFWGCWRHLVGGIYQPEAPQVLRSFTGTAHRHTTSGDRLQGSWASKGQGRGFTSKFPLWPCQSKWQGAGQHLELQHQAAGQLLGFV